MSQLIQSGGVQVVTQLNQIVYLDFDGEYTSYNGEILNVDGVVVEDSKLSGERIAEIVAALNEKYAPEILVVTDGSNGGYYWENGKAVHYDSIKVKAVDTDRERTIDEKIDNARHNKRRDGA